MVVISDNGPNESGASFEYDAFISHATADKEEADRVVAYMEADNIRCWIAPRDMRPGVEFGAEIIHGIKKSKTLIVLLSAVSVTSRYVRAEVERAVTLGHTVYPVRLEDVELGEALEFFLSIRQRIDIFDDPAGLNLKILANAISSNAAPEHVAVKAPRPPWMKWAIPTAIGAGMLFILSLVYDFISSQMLMRQIDEQMEQAQIDANAQLETLNQRSKPELEKLRFIVNVWGNGIFDVVIDGSDANVHIYDVRSYFVVDGEEASRGSGSFKTDGSFRKVEFVVEERDGENIARRDVSKDIREALGNAVIKTLLDDDSAAEAWECTIGGCQVKTGNTLSLCSPLIEDVLVRNSERSRWQPLHRNCEELRTGMPLCYNYDDFPFSLEPGQPFEVQIKISSGQVATRQFSLDPDWLRFRLHDGAGHPSFDHWVKLTPVEAKTSGGPTPIALLGYEPDGVTVGGFHLLSGLQGCDKGGHGNVADDGWLVDQDGKGLVRQGGNLTFGAVNRQPNADEIASLISGEREIAIAADMIDGERMGPYWYTVDPVDAVQLASLRDDAAVKCEQKSYGMRNGSWQCNPASNIGWIGARSVEFGASGDNFSEVFDVDYTAEDFLSEKCDYNQTDCEPFRFLIPDNWDNVYYRITDRNGKTSSIERVIVQR